MISFLNSMTATRLCSSSRAAFKTSFTTTRSALATWSSVCVMLIFARRDVPLIAVIERDRERHTQRPRVGTRHAEIGVVLKSVGLIKHVYVGVSVCLGQLEVGLGAAKAVLVGDQVGRRCEAACFTSSSLGSGSVCSLPTGSNTSSLSTSSSGMFKISASARFASIFALLRLLDLELGLVDVGLDRRPGQTPGSDRRCKALL